MMDKLIQSPVSDSNACYVNKINDEITSFMDFGSGFTTTSIMTEKSEAVANTINTSPELFKDIKKIDKEGRVWFPATITIPGSGMVFADGTSKDDWGWTACKSIPLTEAEKKSGKFPKDQEFKMDMANLEQFPREKGFIDALDYIGFFSINFMNEDKLRDNSM